MAELQAEQKHLSSRTNNTSLVAYNKIKNLMAEKQSERTQFRARIQKLNGQAISSKKEAATMEEDIETKRKEKEWQ